MKDNEYQEWVASLKVGDEVAIRVKDFSRTTNWAIHKVAKITPSGRFNLSSGIIANPDGSLRGHSYQSIDPVTDEIKKSIWRRRMVTRIRTELVPQNLSDEHLKQIVAILNEYKGRKPEL